VALTERALRAPRPSAITSIRRLRYTIKPLAAAAACCTCWSRTASGWAPTNSTLSATTVLGTEEIR
jgi:hypothetical protein